MISKQIFFLNFIFLCSLIEELSRKEESDKTGCSFVILVVIFGCNFGHECTNSINYLFFLILNFTGFVYTYLIVSYIVNVTTPDMSSYPHFIVTSYSCSFGDFNSAKPQ